jgi:cyclopropane fatty-acyl-phospholipid synthase-like methyltransferase
MLQYSKAWRVRAVRVFEQVKASTADCVYDLGCGDGQILIAAAKEFGSKGLGVDLDEGAEWQSGKTARRTMYMHANADR